MYHISLRIAYSETSIRKRLSNFYFEEPHFRADNCSFVYICPSRSFELKEWDRVWTERQASALSRSEAGSEKRAQNQADSSSESATVPTKKERRVPGNQTGHTKREPRKVSQKTGRHGQCPEWPPQSVWIILFSPKAAPTCLFQSSSSTSLTPLICKEHLVDPLTLRIN